MNPTPTSQVNPFHEPETFGTADTQRFECEVLPAGHPEMQARERLSCVSGGFEMSNKEKYKIVGEIADELDEVVKRIASENFSDLFGEACVVGSSRRKTHVCSDHFLPDFDIALDAKLLEPHTAVSAEPKYIEEFNHFVAQLGTTLAANTGLCRKLATVRNCTQKTISNALNNPPILVPDDKNGTKKRKKVSVSFTVAGQERGLIDVSTGTQWNRIGLDYTKGWETQLQWLDHADVRRLGAPTRLAVIEQVCFLKRELMEKGVYDWKEFVDGKEVRHKLRWLVEQLIVQKALEASRVPLLDAMRAVTAVSHPLKMYVPWPIPELFFEREGIYPPWGNLMGVFIQHKTTKFSIPQNKNTPAWDIFKQLAFEILRTHDRAAPFK